MYILSFTNSVVSYSCLLYVTYSDEYIIIQGNIFPILTSTHFKNWKNDVMIALAYANVDSTMTDPKPPEEDAKKSQAWKLQIEYV